MPVQILVVEDESEVRKGLVNLITMKYPNWDVYEAENGAKALAILEKHVIELVLTDIRMPEIDGLQLLDIVRRRFPLTMVMMLSAHPDFSYVQNALSLGASDYLLKPVGVEQLEQTLLKAVSAIRKEKEIRYYVEQNQRIAMQTALTDLMNSAPVYYVNYELQMELERSGFVLLYMSADRRNGLPADKLFWYSVQNMIDEMFVPILDGKPYFINAFPGFFTVLPLRPESPMPELMEAIANLRTQADSVLKSALHIWQIGRWDSMLQLSDAYQQYLQEYFRKDEQRAIGAAELMISLYGSIKSRDLAKCRELVSKLLLPPEFNLEQAKENAYEINLLLAKEIDSLETTAKIQIKRKMLPYRAIAEIANKNELTEAVQMQVKLLVDQLQIQAVGERHYAVEKVMSYIRNHLDQDFKLKDVADTIFLNESYLSTLFKQETGETFSEVVLKTRMEKALELIASSGLPLTEISQRVGYPNSAYFSQVFRKYYGSPPSSIRRSDTRREARDEQG